MKEIELIMDPPFHTHAEVAVVDFPDGAGGRKRQRCKITVEFSEFDIRQLQKRGLDFAGVMEYYKEWLYGVVQYHIAQDWKCIGGWEEITALIEEKVRPYF